MPDALPFDPTAPKELPKPGPRKPLSRVQIIILCVRQIADGVIRCGCGCGNPLKPKCIDEHKTPRESLPAEICDDLDNRALYNPECAKAKTVGDQAIIAKGRHTRGETGQRARRERRGGSSITGRTEIAKRGFQKPDGHKTKWPKRKVGQ